MGFPGTSGPHCSPCLSADLISSFLLIAMLFVISVSLLVGVVKVRALLGKGHGGGARPGLGEPQLPSYPLLVTPTGWAELAAETWEVGILGDPTYTLEIFTGDPHPFIMQMEAEFQQRKEEEWFGGVQRGRMQRAV